MTTDNQRPDVLVLVEKEDDTGRFAIRSDQLEHIGDKLRGRTKFSIFNSIILPLIVTLATLIFTGLFQFISWWNSVSLQNATDVATRATETVEKVTAAIDRRRYATFVFISSLRDLVNAKHNPEKPLDQLSQSSGTTGLGGEGVGAQAAPLALGALPTLQSLLDTLNADLRKTRFENYYDQLKLWNETVDQLLTDLNYSLDRPIFLQAMGTPEGRHEGIATYYEKLKQIDCTKSLTKSLQALDLNPHSLKLRLAGINMCFVQLNRLLATTKATINPATAVDKELEKTLHDRLDHLHTMGSELRCYALHRIDYYIGQKEASILSPVSLFRWMTDGDKREALKHFDDTAQRCSPQHRPT